MNIKNYDWIKDLDDDTYKVISKATNESIVLIEGVNKLLHKQAKHIFGEFDKYSCIKDDKWYKDLRSKYVEQD